MLVVIAISGIYVDVISIWLVMIDSRINENTHEGNGTHMVWKIGLVTSFARGV